MDSYSLLCPCPLSFPPAPVSLWGYPLFPTRLVGLPSSIKIRCDLEGLGGQVASQASIGLPLRAPHSLEKSPWTFRSPRSLGT